MWSSKNNAINNLWYFKLLQNVYNFKERIFSKLSNLKKKKNRAEIIQNREVVKNTLTAQRFLESHRKIESN